jgi:hypothetical protein
VETLPSADRGERRGGEREGSTGKEEEQHPFSRISPRYAYVCMCVHAHIRADADVGMHIAHLMYMQILQQ